jgi:hypothetical protein
MISVSQDRNHIIQNPTFIPTNLDNFTKKLLFSLFLCCLPLLALAQKPTDSLQALQIIDSVEIENEQVTIDSYHNFYVSNFSGTIFRFDSTLSSVNKTSNLVFSPEKNAAASLLDARNPLRLFVFYREFQEYLQLDRFLTPVKTSNLNTQQLGFVRLAAPTGDNMLWILDDADFSLKKYDQQSEVVIFKTPLDLLLGTTNYDLRFMVEYQNQVFLVDKNSGILVFDNMGNFLRKIMIQGAIYCNFQHESICFTDSYKIFIQNIYTTQQQIIALPTHIQGKVKRVLLLPTKILLFAGNKVYIAK